MSEHKKFLGGFLSGLLVATLSVGCIFAGRQIAEYVKYGQVQETGAQADDGVVNAKTMKKLQVIKKVIDEQYALDMVEDKTLENGIYSGLVQALGDPYSIYYSAEEMEEQQSRMEGVYYGIGAYVTFDEELGFARLGDIFPGSPAEESGLKKGDLIIRVDGEYVRNMGLTDVVEKIKGEEGTKVMITILRDGESEFRDVEVERRQVPQQTVTYEMMDNNIAYIRIKEFDAVTIDQFAEAMAVSRESEMLGMILDLRDNPGGSLAAVVEIARKILPKGIIVYTEDKAGERKEYTCDGENELTVPLVVLVNQNSASASEILAGAVQDYEKGTILGTTTYGKGIVQKYLGISDGSSVKLTTSKYFTPKGNNIHGIGIAPDEELELDYDRMLEDGYDNQLERAKELLITGE